MTKKSVANFFESNSNNITGRHLSIRVPPGRLKKIKRDMEDMAELVLAGSLRPSYERMAEFIFKNHAVVVSARTAQRMYQEAQRKVQDGQAKR